MDEDKFQLRLTSNERVHVPSAIATALHIYKTDEERAIKLLNSVFSHTIARPAIVQILKGDKQPIYDPQDLQEQAETYEFDVNDLTEEGIQEIELTSLFNPV